MKYENTNPLSKLHHGEPYFFLRAQDVLAPDAVRAYATNLEREGDTKGATECHRLADKMRQWQIDNPDMVKMPD